MYLLTIIFIIFIFYKKYIHIIIMHVLTKLKKIFIRSQQLFYSTLFN